MPHSQRGEIFRIQSHAYYGLQIASAPLTEQSSVSPSAEFDSITGRPTPASSAGRRVQLSKLRIRTSANCLANTRRRCRDRHPPVRSPRDLEHLLLRGAAPAGEADSQRREPMASVSGRRPGWPWRRSTRPAIRWRCAAVERRCAAAAAPPIGAIDRVVARYPCRSTRS